MNIINVSNITKSFTGRKLFNEASFSVQENEKIGIVGINGTGKSTLLKIIAKEEEADAGEITYANHIVINYLSQNPEFVMGKNVIETVMELAFRKDEKGIDYSYEAIAKTYLTRLGISDFEQKVDNLSGGEKKRLALVASIIRPCDVLMLDEPTNHLDYDMVEWLENFLRGFRGTIIMVTHDRYFLDLVCNRIVEIDDGSIYSYQENYSGFLEAKARRYESALASERKRKSVLRKEIEWIRRGAKARTTKQKSRIQRYEELKEVKGPKTEEKLQMSSVSSRLGRTTIEIENVSKAFGDRCLVNDFSYVFVKGDRIGFVGQNGCGKSTLMKMIAGFIEPDSGNITVGQTVKIGYYCQEIYYASKKQLKEDGHVSEEFKSSMTAWMDPECRVIDYIKETAEYVRTEDGLVSASNMLERFLFTAEQQYSPIEKLSGGERRRLNLLRVLMQAPNILILDEPTNDLDTQTLAILEDYLDNYDGIVITVSHDRYFLDRIVRRIFAFEEEGRLIQYEGGYTDYMSKRPEKTTESQSSEGVAASLDDKVKVSSNDGRIREKKLKFSYNEMREYETIEADIEKIENELAALEDEMSKNATNAAKLNELTAKISEKENELTEKMDRWEYLEDLAARIQAAKEEG